MKQWQYYILMNFVFLLSAKVEIFHGGSVFAIFMFSMLAVISLFLSILYRRES